MCWTCCRRCCWPFAAIEHTLQETKKVGKVPNQHKTRTADTKKSELGTKPRHGSHPVGVIREDVLPGRDLVGKTVSHGTNSAARGRAVPTVRGAVVGKTVHKRRERKIEPTKAGPSNKGSGMRMGVVDNADMARIAPSGSARKHTSVTDFPDERTRYLPRTEPLKNQKEQNSASPRKSDPQPAESRSVPASEPSITRPEETIESAPFVVEPTPRVDAAPPPQRTVSMPKRRVTNMAAITGSSSRSSNAGVNRGIVHPPSRSLDTKQVARVAESAATGAASGNQSEVWLPAGTLETEVVNTFNTHLTGFVESMGLMDMYQTEANKELLQLMSKRAAALSRDTNAILREPKDIVDMAKVGLYDTVIFCDDSWSMDSGQRIEAAKELIRRVTSITTRLDPSGVRVRFFNWREDGEFNGVGTKEEVEKILDTVEFEGGSTRIGTEMRRKILEPFVYAKLRNGGLLRPLLITTVTDGEPKGEAEGQELKDVILECRNILSEHRYPAQSVVFQVSQVGDDAHAVRFLNQLRNDRNLARMVYCTSGKLDVRMEKLKNNERDLERWLLDLLLQGVHRPGEV